MSGTLMIGVRLALFAITEWSKDEDSIPNLLSQQLISITPRSRQDVVYCHDARYTINCTRPCEVVSGRYWLTRVALIWYFAWISYHPTTPCTTGTSVLPDISSRAIKIRHETLACTSWSTFCTISLASSPGVIRVLDRHHFDLPKHPWLET